MNGDPRVWDPSRGVKTRPWGEGYVLLMRCNVVKPEIAPSYRSDFQTAITPHDSPPSKQAGAWLPRGVRPNGRSLFDLPQAGQRVAGGSHF